MPTGPCGLVTTLLADIVLRFAFHAADAGIPFAWVAGDEVYGRSSKLREACEQAGKGYVLAAPVNFSVTLPSGRKAPYPPWPP